MLSLLKTLFRACVLSTVAMGTARVGTHKQDSLGVGNVIQPPD